MNAVETRMLEEYSKEIFGDGHFELSLANLIDSHRNQCRHIKALMDDSAQAWRNSKANAERFVSDNFVNTHISFEKLRTMTISEIADQINES